MDLCGFPVFTGSNLESWIVWLEHYFVFHHFTDDNKLNLSQALMEGDASEWLHRYESFQSWNEMKRGLWFRFKSPPRMVLSQHIDDIKQELVQLVQESLATIRAQLDCMSDSAVGTNQGTMLKMEIPIMEEPPKSEILLPTSITPLATEPSNDAVNQAKCDGQQDVMDDDDEGTKKQKEGEKDPTMMAQIVVYESCLPTGLMEKLFHEDHMGEKLGTCGKITLYTHQMFDKMPKRRKKRKKRHKLILEQMQKITSAYMVFEELSSTRNLRIQLPDFTVITPIAPQLQPKNIGLGYKSSHGVTVAKFKENAVFVVRKSNFKLQVPVKHSQKVNDCLLEVMLMYGSYNVAPRDCKGSKRLYDVEGSFLELSLSAICILHSTYIRAVVEKLNCRTGVGLRKCLIIGLYCVKGLMSLWATI